MLPPCPDEADDDDVMVPLPPIAESAQLNMESLDMLAATSDFWCRWSAGESVAANMVFWPLRGGNRMFCCKLAGVISFRPFWCCCRPVAGAGAGAVALVDADWDEAVVAADCNEA